MGRSSASGGRGRDAGRGIKDMKAHTFAKDDNGRDVIQGNNEDIIRRSFSSGGRSWGTGRGINQDRTSHTFSKDDKGRSVSQGNSQDLIGRSFAGSGRGRGVGRGINQDTTTHTSSSYGRGMGSVLDSGRGGSNSFGQSYSDDSSDEDDESVAHVVVRRGPASQVQQPDPINREWITIVYDEFSNQKRATRTIKANFEAMWSGPWETWKDVPKEDRQRLFERFQGYYQWEKNWDAKVHRCWNRINARKLSGMLRRVRKGAISIATKKGLEVGDDLSVLLDFKPPWIDSESWTKLVEIWNTPEWKAKSIRNTQNRAKSTCKHTLGSQSFVTAKLSADKKLGREISFDEMWMQAHCKKGSRPLDKVSEGEGLGDGLDLEENVHKDVWSDMRSFQTYEKYKAYVVEKYGDEGTLFDYDGWIQASGGMNKGKLYGLNNVSDPLALMTGIPSTECCSTSYEYGSESLEIQRLKGIIEGLMAEKEMEKAEKEREKAEKEKEKAEKEREKVEKEKEKIDKENMLERMMKMEAMLKSLTKQLP
ncbi:hypothetical protein QVD17_37460 [Tagetes erecta]|uniref:Transposase, Ptta/En/Spm, plant n=1 Tax=Tagetes erecta TaxID=13708 RepID=A0AAD8JW21_TARER|nr:hypothetical protein QVD17_37460 [Tagetes erecta]